ncbi:NLRP3 inflammasome complex assembly [Fragilaria crotonensis]|nr:NLRP3 inflammasome complex assembly [Fragilaria crotonensis]
MLQSHEARYASGSVLTSSFRGWSSFRRRIKPTCEPQFLVLSEQTDWITVGAAGKQKGLDMSQLIGRIKGSSIRNIELMGWAREDADAAILLLSALMQNSNQIRGIKLNECDLPPIDLSTLSTVNFMCVQSELTAIEANPMCKSTPRHLKQLVLNYNPIGDTPVKIIADMLQRNGFSVEDVQLIGCEVSDVGAIALAGALCSNNTLTKLALSANSITDVGVSALCTSLSAKSCLSDLQIGYNPFGEEGFQALAAALDRGVSLHTLYLHGQIRSLSSIPEKQPIVHALGLSKTLRELNLSFNHFGDAGASLIAQVLTTSRSIQVLFLTNCYIGDDGTAAIANALGPNKTLQELWLTHNHIRNAGVTSLAGAMAINTTLKRLELGGVVCDRAAALEMVTAFSCDSCRNDNNNYNSTLCEMNFLPSCAVLDTDPIHQFFRVEFEYLRSSKLRRVWREDKGARLALILQYLSRDECFGSDLVYQTLRNMPDTILG